MVLSFQLRDVNLLGSLKFFVASCLQKVKHVKYPIRTRSLQKSTKTQIFYNNTPPYLIFSREEINI